MIDGVYPSQFASVEAMRTSHYRNLKSILNSTSSPKISWLSPDLTSISSRKKYNHVSFALNVAKLARLHQKAYTFAYLEQDQTRYKRNADIYKRLTRISSERSRYNIRT